jgi:hypothetical protein
MMNSIISNDFETTPANDCTSCEIVSPNLRDSNKVKYTRPNGKEVIVLLSGKMNVRFPQDGAIELPRNHPVVVEKPYNLICPDGPGTGRALRITVD